MKNTLIIILVTILCVGCGRGRSAKIAFEDTFEKGPASSWDGGVVQKDITCRDSEYALRGEYKKGGFIYLEKWKEMPVSQKTTLQFAYYCKNVDVLIINFWSPKRKRNYSLTLRNPEQNQWTYVTQSLEDYVYDYGNAINSIHIAVPNRDGALLVIDDVKLYNE